MQRSDNSSSRSKTLRMKRSTAWLIGLAVLITCDLSLVGQSTPIITAPGNGTVVSPGQRLTVTVRVPQNSAFQAVFVVARHLGSSAVLASPPFEFSFDIPSTGFTGPLPLTAVGVTGPDAIVVSPQVVVSVEISTPPSTLSLSPPRIAFLFVGQQMSLLASAMFADGSTTDISQSSRITYQSLDTRVAQVANGVITAVGPGTTQVIAVYGLLKASVTITVPKASRGDLNGDGNVNQDDLNILLEALNQPAIKPSDTRDLNGDGVIDVLDAQILVSLCNKTCQLPGTQVTPVVTWPKPADVSFGTALGNSQLNATTSVPGTFLYSPLAGTVLQLGNGQVLAANFTPSDTTTYTTASGKTTINVLPGSGSVPKIIVTSVFSRDSSQNMVVHITLANAGGIAATSVILTGVKIGTISGTPLPQTVGNISANSLAQAVVTVPGSAGARGAATSLSITGTYTGGTFSATSRITLP